ncbi:MAG: PTS sugar transporter subunit IIA [Gammaproteobacteria bacterium]
MQLADIISPERVLSNVQVKSKKRAFETISSVIASNADISMGVNDIFDSLISRERLGTTAIGHGIAIPHGRVKESNKTIGAFLQLSEGIDCDALDNQSVKLIFAVLVPEKTNEEHLQLLARLAQMFKNSDLREKLMAAPDNKTLYDLLVQWDQTH